MSLMNNNQDIYNEMEHGSFHKSSGIAQKLVASVLFLSIGFAVFMISDSILSIARFAHPIKRQHFYIMSTYILAQTLICISYIYA